MVEFPNCKTEVKLPHAPVKLETLPMIIDVLNVALVAAIEDENVAAPEFNIVKFGPLLSFFWNVISEEPP